MPPFPEPFCVPEPDEWHCNQKVEGGILVYNVQAGHYITCIIHFIYLNK